MVCIPCIFIPIFLFVYHRFLHPIFLRFLPWGKREAVTSTAAAQRPVCPGTDVTKSPPKSKVPKSVPQKAKQGSAASKKVPTKPGKKLPRSGEPHMPRGQKVEDRTGSAMGASGELAEAKKQK